MERTTIDDHEQFARRRLAVALVIVFAATMGFVDEVVQSMGTQVANDIIGVARPLRDKQEIVIAKLAMMAFVVLGVIVAYLTYYWSNLVNLAQLSYQAIIQLAAPIFAGLVPFRTWQRSPRVTRPPTPPDSVSVASSCSCPTRRSSALPVILVGHSVGTRRRTANDAT